MQDLVLNKHGHWVAVPEGEDPDTVLKSLRKKFPKLYEEIRKKRFSELFTETEIEGKGQTIVIVPHHIAHGSPEADFWFNEAWDIFRQLHQKISQESNKRQDAMLNDPDWKPPHNHEAYQQYVLWRQGLAPPDYKPTAFDLNMLKVEHLREKYPSKKADITVKLEQANAKLSCSDLAKKHNINNSALRHRLGRWRYDHDTGYVTVSNRAKHSSKYLYDEIAVMPVIEDIKKGQKTGIERAS